MGMRNSRRDPALFRGDKLQGPVRLVVANGGPGRVDTRLEEALAREMALVDALARSEALLRQKDEAIRRLSAWDEIAVGRIARLTSRQREVMDMVLAGHPSKTVAATLGISRRTVENHRAAIMRTTGTTCLAALARLAYAAGCNEFPCSNRRNRSGSATTGPFAFRYATSIKSEEG